MIAERLPEQASQILDRSKIVNFTYNAEKIQCYSGDTVASALFTGGRRIFGRSFKYYRPRGCSA